MFHKKVTVPKLTCTKLYYFDAADDSRVYLCRVRFHFGKNFTEKYNSLFQLKNELEDQFDNTDSSL